MNPIHRLNIPRWVRNGKTTYDVIVPAVERFNQGAVDLQTHWIRTTIRKRFNRIVILETKGVQ